MAQELNKVLGMVCEKDRYYYNAKKVDAVLAEKDKEIESLKAQLNGFTNRAGLWHYNAMEEHKKVVELQNENAKLKQKLQGICIHCPVKEQEDDVLAEKDAKIRRLKRALWLARAEWAEAMKNYWYARSCHEGDKDLWSIDGSAVKYIGCIKRTNFDWLKIWSEVECKCRAKAEEYK